MLLDDKIAIIYGAGGEVGSAVAKEFASEGAVVHCVGRRRAAVDAVAAEIAAAGGSADTAELDAPPEPETDGLFDDPVARPAQPSSEPEDEFDFGDEPGGLFDEPADEPMDEPADEGGLFDEPADEDDGGLFDEPAGEPRDEPADEGGLFDEPADDGGLFDEPADEPMDEPADEGGLFGEPADEDDGGLFGERSLEEARPEETDEQDGGLFGTFGQVLREPGGLASAELRQWVDNTGRYSCRGRIVRVTDGHVKILKDNGRTSTVPFYRLSGLDLDFVYRQASALEGQSITQTAGL